MVTTPQEAPQPDYRSRCNIALSLANNDQRDPVRNLQLIRAVLMGANVQDLFEMERLGTEWPVGR